MPGLARRLLGTKTCLCTTAKRDSFYDELPSSIDRSSEQQPTDQYGVYKSDKTKRLKRQSHVDESDSEDDIRITEKLRRASANSPANIPMLVVVSFSPDEKGLQKKQIEIQRGFPVNAQFIQNEWLFVKTADNEEGFVPYVCCRPMLRRQPTKGHNDFENPYKPYDFQSNKSFQTKSPSTSIPTFTPPANKKFSLSTALGSQSFSFHNSLLCKKRQDVTSSSCGGDSGFSDCESSSHNNNHYHQSFDSATQRHTRLSNIRTLRSSSNTLKRNGLLVQELSNKKSIKSNNNNNTNNSTNTSNSDSSNQMKYQLLVSTNSAFTHFVKKNVHQTQSQESSQCQSSHSNARLFHRHHQQELSSSTCNLRRPYDSYDESRNFSSPSSKCTNSRAVSSTISSPYIRRTPFSRRSLPHHIQPVLKKSLRPMLSSSPDPYKTSVQKEQHLRHVVLAEPSLPTATTSLKCPIERHFSDLSLNQIENDSLAPSATTVLVHRGQSLSCSSSSAATSSSSASTSSSTNNSTPTFVHIQIHNPNCETLHRSDSMSHVFSTTSNNSSNPITMATKPSSFVHSVSITV